MVDTSMTPVDPRQLLEALNSLLGMEGEIKGPEEAERVMTLMKDANKLVSRCTYINILKATTDRKVLLKITEGSAWDTLNTWLNDAKSDDNLPFLTQLLHVYKQLPVTVDILKKNSCAKTIKQLSKLDDEDIKTLSANIVETWMAKIKSKPSSDSSSDKHSRKSRRKHHHHHHHHDDKRSPTPSPSNSPGPHGDDSNHSNPEQTNHTPDGAASKSSRDRTQHNSLASADGKQTDHNAGPTKSNRPKTVKSIGTKFRSTGNWKRCL